MMASAKPNMPNKPDCFEKHNIDDSKCICCPLELECKLSTAAQNTAKSNISSYTIGYRDGMEKVIRDIYAEIARETSMPRTTYGLMFNKSPDETSELNFIDGINAMKVLITAKCEYLSKLYNLNP